MGDIAREGGSATYQKAIKGLESGVDKLGSTMNAFIGRDVLPELLSMARVGVYVDMPALEGNTIAEVADKRPYLYWYKAEDIRSWCLADGATGNPTEFTALLLRDTTYDIDQHWVLPYDVTNRYRYLWIDPETGFVNCQFYTETEVTSEHPTGYMSGEPIELPIRRIPFVMLELSDSLLSDVADYQIALLNLASSDMGYALKANYPFYTEQFDARSGAAYLKQPGAVATAQTTIDPTNTTVVVTQEKSTEIRVGSSQGRRYPIGTERPGFIHPSPEPLQVSMEKQAQLKDEIRQLVALSVSNLQPRESKNPPRPQDNTTLEAGLSYIGMELEHAERKISEFWAMYEGLDQATVHYPANYSLMDDEDRREQSKALKDLMPMVPSLTFRREVAKKIVDITLGVKIDAATLMKIKAEIDRDPVVLGDPAVIEKDVVNGLVDLNTASLARGYPEGVVEKAKADHAERLARIAAAQTPPGGPTSDAGARGVSDQSANPQAGKEEKTASQKDQTTRDQVKDRTRGEGK
jgi:hypothetical protein